MRRWVVVGGAVLIALAVIAALGGFARSVPTAGPEREPGSSVELARFRVSVESAELTDVDATGYEEDPALQLQLTAVTTGDSTEQGLPTGMVVTVADGVALPDAYTRPVDGWYDDLDPGLRQPVRYTLPWTSAAAPGRLQVAIYDEQRSVGFVDDAESWHVVRSHPVAVVAVPVTDRRTRR